MSDAQSSMMGHNNPPSDTIRNFKRRWAETLFSHPKKPYGAVAMGFKLFVEMDHQGRGAVISDLEFIAACGVSDGSCRTFKKWLLDHGFIRISVRGQRGRKSTFQAVLPAADVASNPQAIPAAPASISEDYRQPLPAIKMQIPAAVAGNAEIPATCAENPPRALALMESLRDSSLRVESLVQSRGRATAPETTKPSYDWKNLSDQLLGACNGALDNPVNCQGLLSLSIPMMWLDQGCDLERDVLPTLTAISKVRHGKRLRTWEYFTNAVQEARDKRLKGLGPTPVAKGSTLNAKGLTEEQRQRVAKAVADVKNA